jgi:MFS family permease
VVGAFNVVWSGALVPAFWVLSPLLERAPGAFFPGLCAAHLVALVLVRRFPREAAPHVAEARAPAPAELRALLAVHRVLHAAAYLVMYALTPLLPGLLERAGLASAWLSVVASTWLLARVVGFHVLGRWQAWHGRWAVAWTGMGVLLAGFGLVVTATRGPWPLAQLLPGLVLFGLGLATLYTAAMDYAFEVGGDESGGGHEALIGLGYTLGPACGLLVLGLEDAGLTSVERREPLLLLLLVVLALGASAWAWTRRRA